VRERQVRFLYLAFPKNQPWPQQLAFLRALSLDLKKHGFEPGALARQKRVRTGFLAQLFLFLAIGGMIYVGIWRGARWAAAATARTSLNGPVRVIKLQAGHFRWAALGTALALMVLQFEGPSQWGAKLGAWLAAVLAPWLGISGLEPEPAAESRGEAWLRQIGRDFFRIAAWCGAGAAVIATLLYQPEFVQRLNVFSGVKWALAAPLALGLAYFFPEWLSRETWKLRFDRQHRWQTLLFLAAGAGVLAVLLLRSGNLIWFPGKAWEMIGRDALEAWLGVRPRFKEFLIGYPLLFLGLGARRLEAFRGQAWPKLCLAAGLLGPMSLINSFCHLHTPLSVSAVRSVHGLWLGAAGGALLLAGAWFWNKRKNHG
jgi:hypothetical protein